MSKREEPSSSQNSNHRARRPFLTIALLGAIFLFVVAGLGTKVFSKQSVSEINMLVVQQVQRSAVAFSSHVQTASEGVLEAPELILVNENSVKAVTPPQTVSATALGAVIGSAGQQQNSREIIHYVVEEGDTVASLANRFNVSVNTILWANDLSSSSDLSVGDEIVILPVSGALHLVRPGDTPSEIALWYSADMDDILYFNDVTDPDQIFVGDILIIPNGVKPAKLPAGRLTQVADGYFFRPVPSSYKVSQGLHPFNAIDFSNGACGGPVYAAAGGVVQRVGYHGVAGNYVRILHKNGVVTFYGHLSGQAVSPGESVGVGQIIGYVGNSGYTVGPTGCHVHFEVRGAANPFAK